MGFRTVVVSSRCKLEYRLNHLVVRGEKERQFFIDELSVLIVQSTAVSLTAALLSELVKNNVKVIFCDEKCDPLAELAPYYGAHNTSKRYKVQMAWKEEAKAFVWREIIKRKMRGQAELLLANGFEEEAKMLFGYEKEVLPADPTNREGHAAKVYFNCILPEGVVRRGGGFVNGCLNYGYAVLLSAINREVTASGYLTQLGIWHDNEFNRFNLSSDLIEPLRTVVDDAALSLGEYDEKFKSKMADVLNYSAEICGKTTTFDVAIRQYVRSVLYALSSEDFSGIVFPERVRKNEQ